MRDAVRETPEAANAPSEPRLETGPNSVEPNPKYVSIAPNLADIGAGLPDNRPKLFWVRSKFGPQIEDFDRT